jgi:hypothetical protein
MQPCGGRCACGHVNAGMHSSNTIAFPAPLASPADCPRLDSKAPDQSHLSGASFSQGSPTITSSNLLRLCSHAWLNLMHAVCARITITCCTAACSHPWPTRRSYKNRLQTSRSACNCSASHKESSCQEASQQNVTWLVVNDSCAPGTMNESGYDGKGVSSSLPNQSGCLLWRYE